MLIKFKGPEGFVTVMIEGITENWLAPEGLDDEELKDEFIPMRERVVQKWLLPFVTGVDKKKMEFFTLSDNPKEMTEFNIDMPTDWLEASWALIGLYGDAEIDRLFEPLIEWLNT